MRKLLILKVLLLGMGLATAVHAEDLDLRSALSESLQNSPAIQKSESALEEAKWHRTSGLSQFLPTVTGNASYLLDKKYMMITVPFGPTLATIPQIIPNTMYSLLATLPLFDGFANIERLMAGNSSVRSSEQEFNWTRFSIQRQAALQFYKVIAAESLKEVSTQNLKTLQDHLKDVQALKNAGVSTQYDLLRVEVQVSDAESEILNAEDQIVLSRLKLAEIYGKEKEDRALKGALPVFETSVLQKLDGVASPEEGRGDLQALSEKSDYFAHLDSASSRYWIPRLSLYGQYQYYNNTNTKLLDSHSFGNAYQVGVNLSWNLFDGLTSAAKAGEAAQQAIQADKALFMARLKSSTDFETWKRKFLYFCKVYRAKLNDQSRSGEAVRLAKEGRRAGARTSTELLDAELDLFRARAGIVNAQMGMIESLIQLELSTGKNLVDWGV